MLVDVFHPSSEDFSLAAASPFRKLPRITKLMISEEKDPPAAAGHLLIDGFNIIHAWPELRDMLGRSPAAARARLGEIVRVIHDFTGIRATVVFDGRGEEIEIERPGEEPTFSFLYTPASAAADSVIEQLTAKAQHPGAVIVASADNPLRQTVLAMGAQVISPPDLAAWARTCRQRQSARLKHLSKQVDRQWRRRENPPP